jgi:hypothetical protein
MKSSTSFSAAAMPETVTTEDSAEDLVLDENQQWRSTKKMSRRQEDVESVIKSFHEEIDSLTKTWEDWETNLTQNNKVMGDSTPPKRSPTYATYSTASKAPYSVKDPPPSAERFSPLRNYVNRSTPARREGDTSSKAPYSSTFQSEPPPAPVETPFPASYATPNRHRRRAPVERMDPQDDTLVKLRQAMDNQENFIQRLQEDNELLREQLTNQSRLGSERERLFVSERDSVPQEQNTSSRQEFAHHDSHHRRYAEPNGRHRPSSTTSTYRTTPMSTPVRNVPSPPQRIHTTTATTSIPEEQMLAGFTPGTRFVAKLAALMKMETGHHAPLSVILDRHWDELFDSSTRSNNIPTN